jgi:hypothetical protein
MTQTAISACSCVICGFSLSNDSSAASRAVGWTGNCGCGYRPANGSHPASTDCAPRRLCAGAASSACRLRGCGAAGARCGLLDLPRRWGGQARGPVGARSMRRLPRWALCGVQHAAACRLRGAVAGRGAHRPNAAACRTARRCPARASCAGAARAASQLKGIADPVFPLIPSPRRKTRARHGAFK